MNFLHLPSAPRSTAAQWNFPLGLPGFRFADLNRVRRLEALDRVFREELAQLDPALAERYEAARRTGPPAVHDRQTSELLVEVGRHLDRFIGKLFHIEEAVAQLNAATRDDAVVFRMKREYLDRQVLKKPPTATELAELDIAEAEFHYREVVAEVLEPGSFTHDPERELAEVAQRLVPDKERDATDPAGTERRAAQLAQVTVWARALAFHPQLRARSRGWSSFLLPEKLDFEDLVPRVYSTTLPMVFEGPPEHRRHRDGFNLTDPRMTDREALREAHYCIICHPRDKDSCSRGFPESTAENGPVQYKANPLGIDLSGCPLDEKISEAHLLKRDGHGIGALAMIMVDNPLCAGTGHRICNDCMKGCIYQKQTPVNIPQIETNILTSILKLPYGFEIYSTLTRWNPLNLRRPYPLPYNGKKVLVVGMGPAGYTLAQHLLNEGFGVVGIDGLKIEPLSVRMRGAKRRVPQPIEDITTVAGPLDQRTILGFGGVSEYGITVRWDKNFLDINYLVLMRRKKFALYDGVRLGGTLTLDDCWQLGFDHVAICAGAGRPTLVPMQNNLLRGVRLASDFLMGLQATGIYRQDSLGNLQVDLPAVVIGGGLTAIDTATELQAYYVVQVEKTLDRYERLVAKIGFDAVRQRFDEEEWDRLQRWLKHGRAVRAERSAAATAGRQPDFNRLVRSWGGVTLAYRKRLQDSPAYRLNHEEVVKALEEGILFAEGLSPTECVPDEHHALKAIRFDRSIHENGKWKKTGETVELPARSVMIAAGTHPNCVYEKEYPGTFKLDADGEFYQGHKATKEAGPLQLTAADAEKEDAFFTSYLKDGHCVSFFGDAHPKYAGNVVKAMASAKHGFHAIADLFRPEIDRLTAELQPEREREWVLFVAEMDKQLIAEVVDAFRLTGNIVEVIVRAPLAARHFHPGQFYRLQNYETQAEEVQGFRLTMEGLALTGAWVDREQGLISLIVLEMGGSSRLCALLEPNERVVLMGPTGTPTEIPENETVVLAGGGLGKAVLFSIALALKERNNRVVYFAGYKKPADLFKRHEIEKACDVVVWASDVPPAIEARRPQDKQFVGNIIEAMEAYATGKLGSVPIPLAETDRVIAIGSDRMMNAVRGALEGRLAAHFPKRPMAIGSINSPMQCMMKEICAQCMQRHVDPATGKESFVFSCFNQDQFLHAVDFDHLHARLRQNSTAEKLTSLWIDHLFEARLVQQG
ncbi:MAG TPA: FAD-dependent oxidoreductase [Gemmatales bacterium]|nr:FAD-dependent oxidoreductase [Gemmatales bacterium]